MTERQILTVTYEAGSEPESERISPARVTALLEELNFLDLCELLLAYSERKMASKGMIRWNHPRVLVHIKQQDVSGNPVPRMKAAP